MRNFDDAQRFDLPGLSEKTPDRELQKLLVDFYSSARGLTKLQLKNEEIKAACEISPQLKVWDKNRPRLTDFPIYLRYRDGYAGYKQSQYVALAAEVRKFGVPLKHGQLLFRGGPSMSGLDNWDRPFSMSLSPHMAGYHAVKHEDRGSSSQPITMSAIFINTRNDCKAIIGQLKEPKRYYQELEVLVHFGSPPKLSFSLNTKSGIEVEVYR